VYVHNQEVFVYHYHHLQMKFVQVNSIIIEMKFILEKNIKSYKKCTWFRTFIVIMWC